MQATITTKTEIDLKLTSREALWIKEVAQNAMMPSESAGSRAAREAIWNGLPDLNELEALTLKEHGEF